MSVCPEAAAPAASQDSSASARGAPPGALSGGKTPSLQTPSSDSRAARLAKFRRDQLIVDYLNRGVSVAEIAARIGVGEKRMRAIIREILARRMPAPPEEFVAIQVSRLNEALLVAYSAMGEANLKAVDRVVKIVRELDRYHGFPAEARPVPEAPRLEHPAAGTLAFGAALVCRPKFAPQCAEMIDLSAEMSVAPLPLGKEADNRARYCEERSDEAILAAASPSVDGLLRSPRNDGAAPEQNSAPASPCVADPAPLAPPPLVGRLGIPLQDPENLESAPGMAAVPFPLANDEVNQARHCEERSDEAIPVAAPPFVDGFLRSARNDGAAREQNPALASPSVADPVPLAHPPLDGRPEKLPQDPERMESAPGKGCAADAPAAVVSPAIPNPGGFIGGSMSG